MASIKTYSFFSVMAGLDFNIFKVLKINVEIDNIL